MELPISATEVSCDATVKVHHQEEFSIAKHCVVTRVKGGIVQTHTLEDGRWEVWFIPYGEDKCYCIASSVNPPDRHYDE